MAARFFDPNEGSDLAEQARTRAAYAQWKAVASPQLAENATLLASTYPHMRPGTVLPLAKAGITPDHPVAKAAAKAEAKRGFGFHSIGDAISGAAAAVGGAAKHYALDPAYSAVKGVSRGIDIGISSVGQTFQGAIRNEIGEGQTHGAEWLLALNPVLHGKDLLEGFKQTSLAAAAEGKDTGSGFFSGGEAERAAVARRRAAAPLINGHAVTIGRGIASQVFEPGHRAYSLLSGLIDAGVSIGSDPTVLAAGPVKATTTGMRLLSGGSAAERTVTSLDDVAESAAKARARAYGNAERSSADFLDDTARHGSDNPAVTQIQRSRDEGLLTADEADAALARERWNISVAGGIDSAPRKTVFKDKVADWLDSKEGRRVREYLRDETSFERMRKLTKGKIDTQTLLRLTDAASDADVLDALQPVLGVTVREKFGVSKAAAAAARSGDETITRRLGGHYTRLGAQLPGGHFDLENVDVAVDQVERWLRNAHYGKTGEVAGMTGTQRIGHWTERMARSDGVNGRYAVVNDMLAEIRDDVIKKSGSKISRKQAADLTRMYADYDSELRRYAIDAIGENAKVPGAVIGADGKALPAAHLFVEYINGSLPMPDAREMRRATSRYIAVIDNAKLRGAYTGTNAVADFLTQQAFKPLVLLRGAWTVRVVGEEQIRLAASGLSSMVAHPLSHIALAMGKKGNTGITGDLLSESDELQQALSRGGREWRGPANVVRTKHRVVLNREDPRHAERFADALADELGKLARDPVMRRVMNGLGPGDLTPTGGLGGLDAVKDWFFHGTGRTFREQMRAAGSSSADRAWLDIKQAVDGSANSADGYIDSLLDRAKTIAGGDERLLEAVATGKVNGKPLTVATASGQRVPNKDAVAELRKILDEGAGPQYVPGDLLVHVKDGSAEKVLHMYDGAVEVLFNTLMSRPTNFLSRSPAFKQFYWQRNAELVGYMDRETQRMAIQVAKDSGVPTKLVKQMERTAASGSGRLGVADADLVAKGYALDATRKLLYDLSDRSQLFDITRVIFPFGEAWKEVATTWARLGVQNPTLVRRGQQVVTGLRSADTNGDGQGFFHTDAQTGEEVFNYPFSGWINEKVGGVPAPFKASVKQLNIFSTSVLPGVGPVVQIPTQKILPDRPEWDGVRDLILPFGDRDMSGGVLESFLPAWAQKAKIALGSRDAHQDRLYANTVMDTARYLMSTGDYDISTPDGQDRLLEDAKHRASKLYGLRALAQFFVPSPPTPEFVVKDKDGNALLAIKLVEEYRKLQDADYTTATEKFIDRFGEGAFLTTISKTTGAGTPTDTMYDFVREHPEIPRKYGDVYGYFLPTGGEFSQKAYNYQLRAEQRTPIKPEEAIEIANQRLGQMIYRQAQSKVHHDEKGRPTPTKAERVWLSRVRDLIGQEYPGYNATPANLRDQKLVITKVLAAADDPILRRTDAGQGLTQYLKARDDALEIARERGLTTFTNAKAAADLRAGLRTIAEQIAAEHPDFAELFERTFNREMVSDDPEEALSGR